MVSICRFRSATRARDRGLHRGVILAAPPRRHSREPERARLSVLTPSPYRRGILAGPGRHRSARAATAASLSNQRFAGQQRSKASGEHFFLVKESLSDGSADFLTVPGLVKSGLVG